MDGIKFGAFCVFFFRCWFIFCENRVCRALFSADLRIVALRSGESEFDDLITFRCVRFYFYWQNIVCDLVQLNTSVKNIFW